MSRFTPEFGALPRELPIFPLPGALLLPRGILPLNVFEPRYLNMVEDVLASGRMMGMIQPRTKQQGESLYRIGCAGRIVGFEETGDERFQITLKGVARFAVAKEVAERRGYRRVGCDWSEFAADLAPDETAQTDRATMMRSLKPYFRMQKIEVNWDALKETPDERLVTSLAMICPFAPQEKQALLEAPDLAERTRILTALIEMAIVATDRNDEKPTQ